MNLRKDIQIKFYIDYKTDKAFRKILTSKKFKNTTHNGKFIKKIYL